MGLIARGGHSLVPVGKYPFPESPSSGAGDLTELEMFTVRGATGG